MKGSIRDHLVQLKASLERRSKKSYYFYLDEQNTLQVRAQGQSRGRGQLGTLIEQGRCCDTYQAFPLLVGQASSESLAERLELIIDGGKQRLRVWWGEDSGSQHLVKGANPLGPSIINNSGSRTIYLILSGQDSNYQKDNYVRPLLPSASYTGYVDGAVDVSGQVVCKKDERANLNFSEQNKFDLDGGLAQGFATILKKMEYGDILPYGLYYGKVRDDNLQFISERQGVIGETIKDWYIMALDKVKQGL